MGDTLLDALQWKKRYDSFSRTPLGKLAWTAFLVWGFYSGLFFRMLNILFLLWWIAPIVLVPLAQRANRQVRQVFDLALCTGPCSCQTQDQYACYLTQAAQASPAGCEEYAGPAAEAAGGCQCQHTVGRPDATAGFSAAGGGWTSQNSSISSISSVFQQKEATK